MEFLSRRLNRNVLESPLEFLFGSSVLALCAAIFGGCAQTRQFQPTVAPESLSDIQFVHYLETVPVVTFAEGCRAIVIAADGKDTFDSHEARYAELKQRNIVRDAWGIESDQVLDLGTLAFMATEVCELPPSANSILFGSWGPGDRRYAVKRAAYYGILNYAAPYKLVTGGQMLLTLSRMDEYMAAKGMYDFEGEEINAPKDVAAMGETANATGGPTAGPIASPPNPAMAAAPQESFPCPMSK